MQLPFAVIPLIHFTSDRQRMGSFANRAWVRMLAWLTAAIIVGLNLRLAGMAIMEWIGNAGPWRTLVLVVTIACAAGLLILLAWVTFEPWVRPRQRARVSPSFPDLEGREPTPSYERILVPLDHTWLDRIAVNHAAAMARLHGAKLYLIHVEEDVTSQVYGREASTAEVEEGSKYLANIAQSLRNQGITVETSIFHSPSPSKEIVRYAREISPDLVIMGAHGHGRLKDLIFGNTINPVRHALDVPMLVVRPGRKG
jgi:manganese transport protein